MTKIGVVQDDNVIYTTDKNLAADGDPQKMTPAFADDCAGQESVLSV